MSSIIIQNVNVASGIPATVRRKLIGVEVTLCTPPAIMFIGGPTVGSVDALKAYEDLQFEFGHLVSKGALRHVAEINKINVVIEWLDSLTADIICFSKECCEYCP